MRVVFFGIPVNGGPKFLYHMLNNTCPIHNGTFIVGVVGLVGLVGLVG